MVGNGWSLAPRAQLSYSKVEFDGFTDWFGAYVAAR
ncbi:autotransporter outer membrane beta-barrel domain-containing protein [Tardiphaga sp. 862_B3_N1_1]